METIEPSWTLEDKLRQIECSEELKTEILRFVNNETDKNSKMRTARLYYRANLHYIEDNINKDGLVEELIKWNNKKDNENEKKY